ncbi:MAG TPA: TonB-dependent receptor [Xanthomonadales bacterium]|nr:TonB-dependent receptor [Xanthomonadales bacterium]
MILTKFAALLRAPGIFLLALWACSFPLQAEEPHELDDLVVTAGLEPISTRDVASSVTIITRAEIERSQAKYLSELLRHVPGFSVSQSGGTGTQTQVRVRGAEANQLLVLIDGIRANDPASNDEFQFEYALTANIERIEIIRGPQSATWGTDALAGVINIIRRKDVRGSYASATAEYGSFGSLDLGVDAGTSGERYQLTGGLTWLDSSGSNISRSGDEDDGADNFTADAMLEITAGDAVQVSVSGQVVDASSDFDEVDFLETGLPVDADRVTEISRAYVRSDIRYNPAGSRWSGNASLNWLDTDNENFHDGMRNSSTGASSLEFRLRASVLPGGGENRNHRLTFALDRDEVDFRQRGIATPFGDPNQNQSTSDSGYAAEYVGQPFGNFTWTLSGRWDDFSDFDDVFTWQLAASQHLLQGLKIRGSAGTGSKAPTFTERFGYYPDYFIGNAELMPETSRGWELGLETDFNRDTLRLGAAWFDQTLEDEIDGFVFDLDTFLFTAANRSEDSQRRGIELEFDADLSDAFSLFLTYTHVDASETDSNGREVDEVRRPRHMASLVANYAFASDRGNVNLDVNYNGARLDSFFPPPFFALEYVELDDFVLAGLAVSWKLTGQLELTGRISNLFNADYEEVLGYARPGRGLFIGLRGSLQQ